MSIESDAVKKMDKIVATWYMDDPVLMYTWTLVEKVADKFVNTISIDTRSLPPQVRYNPNFINVLSHELLEVVMASEAFKLLLKHATSRFQNPKDACVMASQITVDEILKKNAAKIPEFREMFITAKQFDFPEDSYMEEYRRLLLNDPEKMDQMISAIFGDKEETDSPGNDGSSFSEFNDSKSALKEYMDPRNGNSDMWGPNEILDSDIQALVDSHKGSSQQWGKYSGTAIGAVVAANTPKISPREWLRRFQTSVASYMTYMTRMKPNRRFDLEQQGRRRKNITKILFAIDSSGSMSDNDLAEGFAVVNSACRQSVIHYMLWDCSIQLIEKNFKNAKKEFKVKGRGGTNPQAVLDYAEKNCYDGVVIYSDMYFDGNLRKPKSAKVLWMGTNKASKNPTSFGYFCTLDRKG